MNVPMIVGAGLVALALAGCQTPGGPQYAHNEDALHEGCPSGVTVVTNTYDQMRLQRDPNAQTDSMKQAEGRMALAGVKKNEPAVLRNDVAPEESLTSKSLRGC